MLCVCESLGTAWNKGLVATHTILMPVFPWRLSIHHRYLLRQHTRCACSRHLLTVYTHSSCLQRTVHSLIAFHFCCDTATLSFESRLTHAVNWFVWGFIAEMLSPSSGRGHGALRPAKSGRCLAVGKHSLRWCCVWLTHKRPLHLFCEAKLRFSHQ